MSPYIFGVLISGLFVLIGVSVFSVAYLFSGRSVFREWEWRKAVFVTTAAALLLLMISPLMFILLFHDVNLAQEGERGEQQQAVLDEAGEGEDATETIEATEKKELIERVVNYALVPFLLAAFALGLVVGTYPQLNLRWILWREVRHKRGLKFPLFSYGNSWRMFFNKLKLNGLIEVGLREEHGDDEGQRVRRVIGQLAATSVSGTDADFVLRNPRTLEDSSRLDVDKALDENWMPDETLEIFTKESKVLYLRCPPESLQVHAEPINHLAQAYFLAQTSIGFGLFGWATFLTYKFLEGVGLGDVAVVYGLMTVLFLVTCGAFCVLAFSVRRYDFGESLSMQSFLSSFSGWTITPTTWTTVFLAAYFFVASLLFGATWLLWGEVDRGLMVDFLLVLLVGLFSVGLINTGVYFCCFSKDRSSGGRRLSKGRVMLGVIVGLLWLGFLGVAVYYLANVPLGGAEQTDVYQAGLVIAAGAAIIWLFIRVCTRIKRVRVKRHFCQIVRDVEEVFLESGDLDGTASESNLARARNKRSARSKARLALKRAALRLYLRQDLNDDHFIYDREFEKGWCVEKPSPPKIRTRENEREVKELEGYLLERLLCVVYQSGLEGATTQVIEWFCDYLRITYFVSGDFARECDR
ncbi:hypothetical protein FIV42_16840 [Persicimonas caeni]|uniref:Uncharacterized protein n=1 Tax=Persicimonas caeni TaxID=2292766 RepID=A0A4Y6PX65_PERCE|nr:hypothetical protein [Persicimonas caeni]QDG52345.1 hypothetical protein FIV42_16840 [Persicimonas caeni]QED33567.1 hypothetical protein FRD00_16835 [Persicimonas caeni]